MLFYEPKEDERMGVKRVQMAAEAGANVIVTACPFCMVNIEDAIKVAGLEGKDDGHRLGGVGRPATRARAGERRRSNLEEVLERDAEFRYTGRLMPRLAVRRTKSLTILWEDEVEILVCVRRVPDTSENEIQLNSAGNDIERDDLVYSINEPDNYAVEEAIQIVAKAGGNVTVATVGADEDEEFCAAKWPWAPTKAC